MDISEADMEETRYDPTLTPAMLEAGVAVYDAWDPITSSTNVLRTTLSRILFGRFIWRCVVWKGRVTPPR